MEIQKALIVFDALSQETRLRAFRLLVEAGPEGMPAGQISEQLSTPHNTMSFHLTHLVNAGIIKSRKRGRSVIYSADFALMQSLLGFLIKDCCSRDMVEIHEDQHSGRSVIQLNCCPTATNNQE